MRNDASSIDSALRALYKIERPSKEIRETIQLLKQKLFDYLMNPNDSPEQTYPIYCLSQDHDKLLALAMRSESQAVQLQTMGLILYNLANPPCGPGFVQDLENILLESKFKEVRLAAMRQVARIEFNRFRCHEQDFPEYLALLVENFSAFAEGKKDGITLDENFRRNALETIAIHCADKRAEALNLLLTDNEHNYLVTVAITNGKLTEADVIAAFDAMEVQQVAKIFRETKNPLLDKIARSRLGREIENLCENLTIESVEQNRETLLVYVGDSVNNSILLKLVNTLTPIVSEISRNHKSLTLLFSILTEIANKHQSELQEAKQKATEVLEANLDFCHFAMAELKDKLFSWHLKPLATSTKLWPQLAAIDFIMDWHTFKTYAIDYLKSSPHVDLRQRALRLLSVRSFKLGEQNYEFFQTLADVIKTGQYQEVFPEIVRIAAHYSNKIEYHNSHFTDFTRDAGLFEKPELLKVAIEELRKMPNELKSLYATVLIAVHTDNPEERAEIIGKFTEDIDFHANVLLRGINTGSYERMVELFSLMIELGKRNFVFEIANRLKEDRFNELSGAVLVSFSQPRRAYPEKMVSAAKAALEAKPVDVVAQVLKIVTSLLE